MTLVQETAVAVYAVREVALPAGSQETGDDDGTAREVLVNSTSDGGKLPKTTVHQDKDKGSAVEALVETASSIQDYELHLGSVETYQYRFRRYDAVEKTVYVYLCTVRESAETAGNGYMWVPEDRTSAFLSYPHQQTLSNIERVMNNGIESETEPFGSGERSRVERAEEIADQHQTLTEFTQEE